MSLHQTAIAHAITLTRPGGIPGTTETLTREIPNKFTHFTPDERQAIACALFGKYPPRLRHLTPPMIREIHELQATGSYAS